MRGHHGVRGKCGTSVRGRMDWEGGAAAAVGQLAGGSLPHTAPATARHHHLPIHRNTTHLPKSHTNSRPQPSPHSSDLFQGLRKPARGVLLYGPPGNGKTLLVRALAGEAGAALLAVSAASLTSKWHGEAEKLMRALFEVAASAAPSILFIDEADSVLGARGGGGEHEASRRLKTEFLVQFDRLAAGDAAVTVVCATNRPAELDDAVRRRLTKRILVPLPDAAGRRALLARLLAQGGGRLGPDDLDALAAATDGYSHADVAALCAEAAMAPLRELGDALAIAPAASVSEI